MEKKEEKKPKKFINLLIFLIIILVGLVFYARYLGTKGLIVKEYRVESTELPTNFSGIKIVHISDIYYKSTVYMDDLKKLVEKVNKLKPDIIIFTGNLVSEDVTLSEEEIISIKKNMSDLNASLGKYAVKGNADYKLDKYEDILSSSNFILLSNSYELIYNENVEPIFIGGLDSSIKSAIDLKKTFEYFTGVVDEPDDETKTTTEEKQEEAKDLYKIIIMNEGDSIDKVLEYDSTADLILAGNSLNGSVLIPFYGPICIPEGSKLYSSPSYTKGDTKIFISSGMGTKQIPFRFLNKPSFNLYRLKSL